MMVNNQTAIDQYIEPFPKEVQVILQRIRKIVHDCTFEAVEVISYGIPTFKLKGKSLVHFAGWKNHIGFYATPNGNEAFKKELSVYQGAKGSVKFPLNQPIPYDLIEKIVKFRIDEIKKAPLK